jgi:type IV pilus assembly protein PilV
MNANRRTQAPRGFTLIELLITLVIVSVGMLGLAKLEAAAVSESGLSRVRSLMTYQAESLAALMRADRAYWGTTTGAPPGFDLLANASAMKDNGGTNKMDTSGTNCLSSSAGVKTCTPSQIAYWDMQGSPTNGWVTNFHNQFPNATANVTCIVTATLPTTCDITLTWSEHSVAINRTSDKAAAPPKVAMILHVQP